MEITLSGKEVTLKKPESRTGDAAIVVLREKQAYSSFYQTPVGVVAVQVYPTLVHVQKEAEQGKIELEYITSIADTQAVNRLRVEYARRYRDIQNRKREGENDGH